MNDNSELLKFAVENIEEWPEEWTHLRSDHSDHCFFTEGVTWDTSGNPNYWATDEDNWVNYDQLSTETPQVISKADWLEGRKGNDKPKPEDSNTFPKSMLEAGKHVVFTDDGFLRNVVGDKLESEGGYYVNLDDVDEDLTFKGCCNGSVRAVYQLVWSREDSEKESKRKQLEEEVKKLEQELKLKKEELENVCK